MKPLEKFFFQLTIFLFPANLAFHLFYEGAYVHGRLIDYLLPKIYLSDLTLLGLIIIYLLNTRSFNLFIRPFKNIYLVTLLIFISILAAVSSLPLSSYFYIFKFLELILFVSYLHHRPEITSLLSLPLSLSLIFQSILSLYQFIAQKSLYGYFLLGENNLESLGIAKASLFGYLKSIPYGTTSHPNVLAGFFVIGVLILWLIPQKVRIPFTQKVLNTIAISLSITVLPLTISLTAIFGLSLGALLIIASLQLSRYKYILLLKASIFSALVLSPLLIFSLYRLNGHAANDSIVTRYELNQASFSIIKSHILTGIGANQFVKHLADTNLIPGQKTYIYQPVHHTGLLIFAEVGLIGLGLILLLAKKAVQDLLHRPPVKFLIPLTVILIMAGNDHFFITLQTGQLLTALAVALPFIVSE